MSEREIINYPTAHGVVFTETGLPSQYTTHWHNEAEFAFILKEGCELKIGETLYQPHVGDIILIWPRELHETLNMEPDGAILIQFSPRILEANTDLASAGRFLNECHHIRAEENPYLTHKLMDTIDRLRETYFRKQLFLETKCKLHIYELMILIGEHVMKEHREMIGNDKFSDRSWDYIRFACRYIADHAAENISQAEVAEQAGLSPYYFSKLFNEYTDMTFPAYLSGLRVQNATNLLADERYSITECAFMAGFQSTTTFNKVFHEVTGFTPREYRKMHKRSERI